MIGQKIGFIGGGNMARSLVGGLVHNGFPAGFLRVADINAETLATLQADFGVTTTQDNQEVIQHSDVVVFAVKPQVMKQVLEPLSALINRTQPLIMSIAAGVREQDISTWVGGKVAVVRGMPNTPALVGAGVTGLYANTHVSPDQRQVAGAIMDAVSITFWVDDEAKMDAVTAASGSGPAYFFLVMEAMEAAAVELGLKPEQARKMAIETAYGAAKMARESESSPAVLRANVTSEGGTTAAALDVFERHHLKGLFREAMQAAHHRSEELGELIGRS